MGKLKPCPGCGNNAEIVFCDKDGRNYCNYFAIHHARLWKTSGFVQCKRCGMRTKIYNRADAAVRTWNRRCEHA